MISNISGNQADSQKTDKNLQRISSIDILRTITMILMIFVNDFWSLNDIPEI